MQAIINYQILLDSLSSDQYVYTSSCAFTDIHEQNVYAHAHRHRYAHVQSVSKDRNQSH